MSTLESTELQQRIDALADQLRRRTKELQTKGQFSDNDKVLSGQVRQRSAQLDKKVADAARRGAAWEFIKAELLRDYYALVDEILLFEWRLDSEARRHRRPASSSELEKKGLRGPRRA